MIRDLVRAACVIATMAAGCSLLIETRMRLAAIDAVTRQAPQQPVVYGYAPEPPGPLARFGQAAVGLADAALGVVR